MIASFSFWCCFSGCVLLICLVRVVEALQTADNQAAAAFPRCLLSLILLVQWTGRSEGRAGQRQQPESKTDENTKRLFDCSHGLRIHDDIVMTYKWWEDYNDFEITLNRTFSLSVESWVAPTDAALIADTLLVGAALCTHTQNPTSKTKYNSTQICLSALNTNT